MRLCRFSLQSQLMAGFYEDDYVIPLPDAIRKYAEATGERLELPTDDDLLTLLPHGAAHGTVGNLADWVQGSGLELLAGVRVATEQVDLLVPVPRPRKLFLLAGNYAKHIEEQGGVAAERAETFPYVFMKPPTTTLTDPGQPVVIPQESPSAIDWELELAVVIGRLGKGISESEALRYVAGYTVINDISNRKFRPNPNRRVREKDAFFDWLHGKWHDSFCPCGPCIVSADSVPNPQQLQMKLSVNGELKQDASTAQQIFPVAAVIEFLSSFVTLEPGDMISTGTPAGIGHTSGTYLQPGDTVTASIERIGTLRSPVVAE